MPALPCASQPSGPTAVGSCRRGCGSLWCSSHVASSSSRASLAPSSSPRIRRGRRTWSGHCQGNGCSIYPYCRFHLPSLGLERKEETTASHNCSKEESLLFHGVSTVKGKKKEKGSLELSRLYNKEGLLHVLISSEANIISNQVKKLHFEILGHEHLIAKVTGIMKLRWPSADLQSLV
ncbi:uncharacterized protein [Aegilops tauschii subsp. strangulata]|uniref:uncharacterized protein isoform X2 n=1 Tax=Aegilops tauschii subsp. strangulata TaxID=200361 RepID=UPI001ABCC780